MAPRMASLAKHPLSGRDRTRALPRAPHCRIKAPHHCGGAPGFVALWPSAPARAAAQFNISVSPCGATTCSANGTPCRARKGGHAASCLASSHVTSSTRMDRLWLRFTRRSVTICRKPHTRDEVYFVTRGSGLFFDGEQRHSVMAGSFLFVPLAILIASKTDSQLQQTPE